MTIDLYVINDPETAEHGITLKSAIAGYSLVVLPSSDSMLTLSKTSPVEELLSFPCLLLGSCFFKLMIDICTIFLETSGLMRTYGLSLCITNESSCTICYCCLYQKHEDINKSNFIRLSKVHKESLLQLFIRYY